MTPYSNELRDRIFAKGYGFLSFAKHFSKNIDRNIIKSSVVNTAKYLFIMLNNLVQMHVKLVQKEQLKKYQKKMVNLLIIKLLI